MRYNYLRGPGGRFRNPYDHGLKKNCSDFLINGYNEDTEYVENTVEPQEGFGMMQMSRGSNHLQNGLHANGNGHVAINVDPTNTKNHDHEHQNQRSDHVHSAHCSHGRAKTENVPLGLGLGLGGRNASSRGGAAS